MNQQLYFQYLQYFPFFFFFIFLIILSVMGTRLHNIWLCQFVNPDLILNCQVGYMPPSSTFSTISIADVMI